MSSSRSRRSLRHDLLRDLDTYHLLELWGRDGQVWLAKGTKEVAQDLNGRHDQPPDPPPTHQHAVQDAPYLLFHTTAVARKLDACPPTGHNKQGCDHVRDLQVDWSRTTALWTWPPADGQKPFGDQSRWNLTGDRHHLPRSLAICIAKR